ncbi:DUF5977 domain-containing protein [Flavobacterium sp. ZS1P70]|uniref:DUF5977 domain-containing protein n=1 Tax=Flavobacterium zhoui TaxID=3230414 RepID=A0ABW6IAV6_9FLAO
MNLKFTYQAIFFISLLLLSTISFAQSDDKPSKYFPNVVPPPPNSASLGLYGQVPLNQFTGSATVSIPLLEVKSNNLTMPVSLSYSSDGIKVDQYESNVGMGWVLNAGGVITRQVFDYQDNYNGRMQKPNTAPDSNEMIAFLDQASTGLQVDTQPDIFCYNVNGMSGKFFLDNTNTPVEIEASGLKIEITADFLSMGFAPNSLPEITITDTKGIKFYFGGLNAIESSSSRRIFIENPGPISDDVKTSWYLTKIEDPSTNNQITLNYDSRSITYVTGNEQSLEYTYAGGAKLSSALYNYQYKSYATESILKEINSNNCKVVFGNSKRFTDPDFPLFKVDDISFFNLQGALIKKIKFDYVEYSGNSFPNSYNQSPDYFKKRFYLKQINEFSTNSSPITHQFEYYSPENLPARFSFAKDNYGVFNGKTNSSLISDEIVIPYSVVKASFSDGKLAYRRSDKNFGYFGLLKKVIYPTKGTTTLEYEPHVRGTENRPIYPVETQFALSVLTNDIDLFNNTNTASIHSSIEQTIKINGNVINNCSGTNPYSLQLKLEIRDLSNGVLVNFYNNASNLDAPVLIGTSYTITANPSSTNDVFTLQADKDYSIKITLSRPCMFGNVYFNYFSSPITFQTIEKEIGGFRIAKTIKNSAISSNLEIEKYSYNPYDCVTCQSGYYINQAPIAYIRKIERANLCETPNQRTLFSVGSSNLARIYSSQNAQFGYEYVTKSYGNNFENGGEEFKHEIIQDGLPITKQGEFDITTPFTNGFGSGRLLSHKIFNSTFKKLKETVNQYEHNTAKDKSVTGYNAYKSSQNYSYEGAYGVNPPVCNSFLSWDQYTYSEYSLRSQWNYLKQSVETQYDLNGLNPITNTTTYTHSNPSHLQLTSQNTTNSKGETFETKYYYPQDPQMVSEPFVNEMIVKNMIGSPIDSQTFKGGEKLSEQKTEYGYDPSTSNLLLPKYIYVKKGAGTIDKNTDKKTTYNQYDTNGTLLQYTPESGTPVTIIWGYNKTQPIAKIENATYSQIAAQVVNLQNLSDADNDNCITATCKEQLLRNGLNLFRNSLPSNTLVTTYTYNPLIGVTSITDPKGLTSYYEYDQFNRLKFIKDQDLNILQRYCYNYKGQQIDCSDTSSTSVITYTSAAKSGTFTKNTCAAGGFGSSVTYIVASGAYSSSLSQADADGKAQNDVNNNGQTYANTNGTCTFSSMAQSGSFTKNNCASGGVGSTVPFSQAAGAQTSTISQADADSKGLTLFNTNGQANANTNGTCTFSSMAQSGSFTKNNCASGGLGSTVPFSQAAGAQTSTISQTDADSKGLSLFNTNGQANANTSGTCTFSSMAQSGSFTKNNCASGGLGSSVPFSQAAGAQTSTISQADADSKGLTLFNTNGQGNANTNGTCTFSSAAKSGSFTKNNCASGGVGSSVPFSQAAGAQTSTISQADADSKGLSLFNTNGQANANTNGNCTFSSMAQSGPFTKNNCASGGVGSSVPFSQAAGAQTSTISQADADSKGLSLFNTNGQANANTSGTCTFSSMAQSGSFTKNNCASGGVGSSVPFSQAAGAQTSTISQADADSKGLTLFNTNGQGNANTNGTCTFSSAAKSGSFTKNNCASGGVGSSVPFSQAAGAQTSTISQADADSKGLSLFNTNGQANANTNGNCTFSSMAQSGPFTKNNCASGGVGSSVPFSQAAGAQTSTISQADADSKGLSLFNTNGQANANTNGTCTFSSAAKSGSFTKNNCASGYTGSPINYNVVAGSYNSTISQADADSKAQADVNNNGQNYANANGTCTQIGDTTAPSTPAITSSSRTTKPSVIINWTGSTDNVAVTGYELWRDVNQSGTFSLIATPTTSPYTDVYITAGVGNTYSYKMRARDAAGNWSGFTAVKVQVVP